MNTCIQGHVPTPVACIRVVHVHTFNYYCTGQFYFLSFIFNMALWSPKSHVREKKFGAVRSRCRLSKDESICCYKLFWSVYIDVCFLSITVPKILLWLWMLLPLYMCPLTTDSCFSTRPPALARIVTECVIFCCALHKLCLEVTAQAISFADTKVCTLWLNL